MNTIIYPLLFCLLFGTQATAQTYPVTTVMNNGSNDSRINLVYLGDGYTSAQQTDFLNDVGNINNDLFAESPFLEYAAFFNAHAIEVPSAESGADHPGDATDVTEPAHPVLDVNTVFNVTFDYFDIHRLLVPLSTGTIYNTANNNFPNYDQLILLSNTPYYGGSGGNIATSSVDLAAAEISIHELGHSFGNLSDEYWAGDFYANENYNMTQETNPALVKWEEWHGENGIGIYRHCCGGTSADWYRPHQGCKMRYLGSPFCAVCKERIIDVIYSLVSPLENYAPSNAATVNITNAETFDLDVIYPVPNTLVITWELNGEPLANATETVTLDDTNLWVGMNVLTVTITDATGLSKSYLPENGYVFTETWQVNYTPNPCPNYMQVYNSPVEDNTYHAAVQLSSKATMLNTAIVEFKAGTEIDLTAPFDVPQGAMFSATIEDCTLLHTEKPSGIEKGN